MKIYKSILLFSLMALLVVGCNKDDFTGHATSVPTTPSITIDLGTITPVTDAVKTTFSINITMSDVQIVDVPIYINITDGNATEGDDFSLSANPVIIKAGATTAKLDVTIADDELAEATETFTLQIGDDRTANANLTPATAQFTINNATSADLGIALSWDSEVYGTDGALIDPTDLADMIFLLLNDDLSYNNDFDGSGFESATLSGLADGTYYLATSFYGVMDLGDQGSADLGFTVEYAQVGVQSGSFDFPAALNTVNNIDNTYYLAKITKSGTTWTVTKFDGFVASDLNFASASWNDGLGDGSYGDGFNWQFPNEIVTAGTTGNYTIDGLNIFWMENIWGEGVVSTTPVSITFNDDGTLTIPQQAYMVTDYAAAPNYDVYGDGTWNRFMTPVAMTINYEMYNTDDAYGVGEWLFDNGYSNTKYFIADIVYGSKKRSIERPKITGKITNKPY